MGLFHFPALQCRPTRVWLAVSLFVLFCYEWEGVVNDTMPPSPHKLYIADYFWIVTFRAVPRILPWNPGAEFSLY
jgi:hypothetical protein